MPRGSLRTSRVLSSAEAFGGERQQLRNGLDVPVGETDLGVAHIRRELRQLARDLTRRLHAQRLQLATA